MNRRVSGCDTSLLIAQLKTMLDIWFAEEHIGDVVTSGKVDCPAHFAIGRKGVALGVSSHLRPTDRAFGAHHSHAHRQHWAVRCISCLWRSLGSDGVLQRYGAGSGGETRARLNFAKREATLHEAMRRLQQADLRAD